MFANGTSSEKGQSRKRNMNGLSTKQERQLPIQSSRYTGGKKRTVLQRPQLTLELPALDKIVFAKLSNSLQTNRHGKIARKTQWISWTKIHNFLNKPNGDGIQWVPQEWQMIQRKNCKNSKSGSSIQFIYCRQLKPNSGHLIQSLTLPHYTSTQL